MKLSEEEKKRLEEEIARNRVILEQDLAVDFIDRIADLYDEHDLDELLAKIEQDKKTIGVLLKEREQVIKDLSKEIKNRRALEIIKRIGLLEVDFIMNVDYECYVECRKNPIPKEEFDLLKEELN